MIAEVGADGLVQSRTGLGRGEGNIHGDELCRSPFAAMGRRKCTRQELVACSPF